MANEDAKEKANDKEAMITNIKKALDWDNIDDTVTDESDQSKTKDAQSKSEDQKKIKEKEAQSKPDESDKSSSKEKEAQKETQEQGKNNLYTAEELNYLTSFENIDLNRVPPEARPFFAVAKRQFETSKQMERGLQKGFREYAAAKKEIDAFKAQIQGSKRSQEKDQWLEKFNVDPETEALARELLAIKDELGSLRENSKKRESEFSQTTARQQEHELNTHILANLKKTQIPPEFHDDVIMKAKSIWDDEIFEQRDLPPESQRLTPFEEIIARESQRYSIFKSANTDDLDPIELLKKNPGKMKEFEEQVVKRYLEELSKKKETNTKIPGNEIPDSEIGKSKAAPKNFREFKEQLTKELLD